ncbi:hypothetical protein C4564_00060 [Candidatus Microgenomates bacterium]|nr:MAG: hypothetical protein C4564_00060 [Candidatus Microgenomates bacterium]
MNETKGPNEDYDTWKAELDVELAEKDPDIPDMPESTADNPPEPVGTPQKLVDKITNTGKPENQPYGHASNVAGLLSNAENEGKIPTPIKASKD